MNLQEDAKALRTANNKAFGKPFKSNQILISTRETTMPAQTEKCRFNLANALLRIKVMVVCW